ncbi:MULTISPECIES: CAP domain-containing protein [unclassified Streptomyces]|uniref:CAP domain-containing protein n=1 Tax=unclassified Streptomyces TaxID=2593676 RepID=UPI00089ABDD8|nr:MULTISPECIES: CAP domain-containing protein [unclassified Streptomyces]SED48230.1 Uncharacterized conserved protein YkwD, contains CAP (CSP/antigen 5/PR1) domain [Streptomyces sp. 2112.3]
MFPHSGRTGQGVTHQWPGVQRAIALLRPTATRRRSTGSSNARKKHGCEPLHRDPRMDKAARLHSQDMAAHGFYAHTGPNGKGPKERMEAQGYDDASAENIDAWPRTPQGAFDAWMHSPHHRDNILSCQSKGTGIGVALGGKLRAYWTQDFGYK